MGAGLSTTKTVVIIGGGPAGVGLAKKLDAVANVILIERRDVYLHNIAGLRASTVDGWTDRCLIPYDKVLKRGKVVRGEVTGIDQTAKKVIVQSEEPVSFDYLVLATGANQCILGRGGELASGAEVRGHFDAVRAAINQAQKILIIGGGAVGCEMAGEIPSGKEVTLIHSGEALLSMKGARQPPAGFQASVLSLLQQKKVNVLVNDRIEGIEADKLFLPGKRTLTTKGGKTIETDLILLATGVRPPKSSLLSSLNSAVDAQGFITVNQHLQVVSGGEASPCTYALGDVCSPPWEEMKTYMAIMGQLDVVAKNILGHANGKKLIAGKQGPNASFVPIGPSSGAGYFGTSVVPRFVVVSAKSKDLFVGKNWKDLTGRPAPAPRA